ncbi:MAG: hypothetical protein HOE62_06515 [Alphaproteobacteria bacterium]|nr:hypothetical protein [Alphaproteobacteria bacterium]
MSDVADAQMEAPLEGLLDGAKPETEEAVAAADTEASEISHIDPASTGEKPDWLPDQFYSDESGADFEALAKSQAELFKKMRSGKHIVPEDGYDAKFLGDQVAADDPMLGKFNEMAKDRGMSQDDYEAVLGMYLENRGELMGEGEVEEPFDQQAELAKLGQNGAEIVTGTVKWMQGLAEKGQISADDFEEMKIMGGTAAGIRVFNKLRSMYGEQVVPVRIDANSGEIPTQDDVNSAIADPRYQTDEAYRNKVYKMVERMNPTGGSSSSPF